jgi:hypothetical protein
LDGGRGALSDQTTKGGGNSTGIAAETIVLVRVERVEYNLSCFSYNAVHVSGTRVEDAGITEENAVSLVDAVFSYG